jgi:hypothetical protein
VDCDGVFGVVALRWSEATQVRWTGMETVGRAGELLAPKTLIRSLTWLGSLHTAVAFGHSGITKGGFLF